ncbi:hypothetical protein AOG28_13280 [Cobetia sp. UCD-24C]|nr:hypothetical protein AOG28_13280 [Cobetia sp. UCD-24C]
MMWWAHHILSPRALMVSTPSAGSAAIAAGFFVSIARHTGLCAIQTPIQAKPHYGLFPTGVIAHIKITG